MKTFDDIVIRIGAMESLSCSIEQAVDDAILETGMTPGLERMQNLFYILDEQIRTAKEEADEVAGHIMVCNAVFAAGHVRELEAEIKRLRASKRE